MRGPRDGQRSADSLGAAAERFAGERKTQLQAWEGQDAAEIRAEGERVAGMIERWDPPFSDGWEKWQPDPAWPLPKLPPDWTQ